MLVTTYIAHIFAIVHSPDFESGILKIQLGTTSSLTGMEMMTVLIMHKLYFVTSNENDGNVPTGSHSIMEAILRRNRKRKKQRRAPQQ